MFRRQCLFTINLRFHRTWKMCSLMFGPMINYVRSYPFNRSIVPCTMSMKSVYVKDTIKQWHRSHHSMSTYVLNMFGSFNRCSCCFFFFTRLFEGKRISATKYVLSRFSCQTYRYRLFKQSRTDHDSAR
jgi:hypothetical protein